jgi:hypothetical protein
MRRFFGQRPSPPATNWRCDLGFEMESSVAASDIEQATAINASCAYAGGQVSDDEYSLHAELAVV